MRSIFGGCSVTLSEAHSGKVQLSIKYLGGKALDSEHYVMIFLPGWKQKLNMACWQANVSVPVAPKLKVLQTCNLPKLHQKAGYMIFVLP